MVTIFDLDLLLLELWVIAFVPEMFDGTVQIAVDDGPWFSASAADVIGTEW